MPHRCWVPGCKTLYKPGEVQFFNFPKDEHRRMKWKRNIGVDPDFNPGCRRICQYHFEEKDLMVTGKGMSRRLNKAAVPTIFEHIRKLQRAVRLDHPYQVPPGVEKKTVKSDEVFIAEVEHGGEIIVGPTVYLTTMSYNIHSLQIELQSLKHEHEDLKMINYKINQKYGKLEDEAKNIQSENSILKEEVSFLNSLLLANASSKRGLDYNKFKCDLNNKKWRNIVDFMLI